MSRISAIYDQLYVGQRLALSNGLAHVGRIGPVKLSSDHAAELLANFRSKDVALFGVGARLPDHLGERMLAVDDCFPLLGRLETGKRTFHRLMQLKVLLYTLRKIVECWRLLAHRRGLGSPSYYGNPR